MGGNMVGGEVKKPLVSVVMSVYNGEKYLEKTIDSVLSQEGVTFEFIIVDDCSNDDSVNIIKRYNDKRIVLIRNEQNVGLAGSLNKAISMCKGDIIARIDADDICLPGRFKNQSEYLIKNNLDVCGGEAELIDELDNNAGIMKVRSGKFLKILLWKPGVLIHPTIMAMAEFFKKNKYNEKLLTAQDYELWLRTMDIASFDNMNIPLIKYRIGSGVTSSKRGQQLENSYSAFKQFVNPEVTFNEFIALVANNRKCFVTKFQLYKKVESVRGRIPLVFKLLDSLSLY